MHAELLLSHDDTHHPVLSDGLDIEWIPDVPIPAGNTSSKYLRSNFASPNDLAAQRWGLVAPKGPEGDRLLRLIEPLRELRQLEQGGHPVQVYRPSGGMTFDEAHKWKDRTFGPEKVDEEDRPSYLLILGDLDAVSLELQQALATDSFVGRLTFPTNEGYRAYVAKVLRWADAPSTAQRANLLFYTARDGSSATEQGHGLLMQACIECLKTRHLEGRCHTHSPVSLEETGAEKDSAVERFLGFASREDPSVLLSLSHGLGTPTSGRWESSEKQRARQGALLLTREQLLTAADVASRPFLPGGIWFGLACFSAGTPARSAYTPWLRDLPSLQATRISPLASLPPPGERPFVAALPQAALANPEGPLAVVGHVDLAWTLGFNDQGRARHARFHQVIEQLGHQVRAGAAMKPLLDATNELGRWLSATAHQARVAQSEKRRPRETPADWAFRWLKYHDLASYVLLGDPAVRLPMTVHSSRYLGSQSRRNAR
ncbi:hypothetical protein HV824_12155 [Myxococcus sp. AM009]|uniref:hypothetical protein n=1 Tax=Myxococcus sp. AM009 TaxID=2745137 RepID=UPI00159561A2|nr:hypothetical protein [Myxococcus sp. AM009]NVI98867.1 hypothetical protein [Myxococcus sp. AM009]